MAVFLAAAATVRWLRGRGVAEDDFALLKAREDTLDAWHALTDAEMTSARTTWAPADSTTGTG